MNPRIIRAAVPIGPMSRRGRVAWSKAPLSAVFRLISLIRLARAIVRKVGSLIIGSSCFSRPGSWPCDGSPAFAVENDIDADHSHREQGEHEEQRDRHPARRPCRGRQDGQKRAHAHQHAERNQGERQTLTDGGSLTRSVRDKLLNSLAGGGRISKANVPEIAGRSFWPFIAHLLLR